MIHKVDSELEVGDVVEVISDISRNKFKNEYRELRLMGYPELIRYEDEYEDEDIIMKETQLLIAGMFTNSGINTISFSDFPREKYMPKDFRKVPERSWMNQDYEKGKVFMMPVQYVAAHLDDFAKERMDLSKYDRKEVYLAEKIDSGHETIQDWPPLKYCLDEESEIFHVIDGITRLRYSLRKKISHIRIKLIH